MVAKYAAGVSSRPRKAQTGEVPGRLVEAPAGLPAATSAGLSSLLILLKNTVLIIFYDFLRFVNDLVVNDLGQATWIKNTMFF